MTFPINADSPVAYPGPPPQEADVVIVGGGVVGIMSALFLARAGRRPVVIEKGRVAGEQSSRNWGWIRAQGRDWGELPFAMDAKSLWAEIAVECDVDIGFRQTGVTYLARSEKAMQRYAEWQARAVDEGLDCTVLRRTGIDALMPDAQGDWVGGIHTASDCRAEPWVAVPAVARLACRDGARIVENCAVRGLDVEGGRVAGVVTEAGRIKSRSVVVSGGAWSRLLLQRHGVTIPQLTVRSSVVATKALPQVFEGQATDDRVAFRRRADGGYTLASGGRNELFVGRDAFASVGAYLPALRQEPFGTTLLPNAPTGFPDAWGTPRTWALDGPSPFERHRVLNPKPSMRRVTKALRAFEQTFPQISQAEAKAAWAGMIDTMPDFVPVIDEAANLPGLVVATGLSGHGFGIGPAFGKAVAAILCDTPPDHSLSRFRIDRFARPLELGPTL